MRVARGDLLTPEERTVYDAGCREWDDSEVLRPLQDMKQARDKLREMEAQRAKLEQRRGQLDAQIASLERRLAPHARELLGVEE
jgi:septal ring factor EnvC (AmiA/AmiB activator)